MSKAGIHLVWLKRDLRVRDHAPLVDACERGSVVLLYIYEPELLFSEEHDSSHLVFVNQALTCLDTSVRKLGGRVTYRVGEACKVISDLHQEYRIRAIYSHEETGNALTYARDLRVGAWLRSQNIPWYESTQTGVVRRLRSRDGWAARWRERMAAPVLRPPPQISCAEVPSEQLRSLEALGLAPSTKVDAQPGGETEALATLRSFLTTRGVHYLGTISRPEAAAEHGSRLSPHLAYGTISMRWVYQRTRQRMLALRTVGVGAKSDLDTGAWALSLRSFASRLHWHCHFMQKLEDEPRIEFENMARVCDGLREESFDDSRFQAWKEGRTGYPMIDACMRSLHATGWVNFRMRAMLMSFASYHLWLHWRKTSVYLASQFLDFEPGIHFSQAQMQSGTTGINTVRIYNPAKQARDQDPSGSFIRTWVPELASVPVVYLACPSDMPGLERLAYGFTLGKQYPEPIVDAGEAMRFAKTRIYALRKTAESRAEGARVHSKHGSRKPRPKV
jgi:deoxyribodipyrimidine photo-lyase